MSARVGVHRLDRRVFLVAFSASIETARVVWITDPGEVTVGCSPKATLRFDKTEVASLHARIWRLGDRIQIEPLSSADRISLDGRRILAAHDLRAGDEVSIGRVTAIVGFVGGVARATSELPSQPSNARPPPARRERVSLDPQMKQVAALVRRIASSPLPVLILGECGVGKEVVAREIHRTSDRHLRPLISVNCAVLSEQVLETELFGRAELPGGVFEAANGATLLLDEIGEMPLGVQARFLRLLDRKTIALGTRKGERPADARVLATSQHDLESLVTAGRFRRDLLFRISGFTITVPPLRDRISDIVPLAEDFTREIAAGHGRAAPALTHEVREALERYRWPGNVRELQLAMERAVVLCGEVITLADLPPNITGDRSRGATGVRGHLAEVERAAIVAALDAADHNQTHAARTLGMSRRALIYKMEKYGLKRMAATHRARKSK